MSCPSCTASISQSFRVAGVKIHAHLLLRCTQKLTAVTADGLHTLFGSEQARHLERGASGYNARQPGFWTNSFSTLPP